MRTYKIPGDLLQQLNDVIKTAEKTRFFSEILSTETVIGDLEDFSKIPITPLNRYRRQKFADVVANPADIDWIIGPHRGYSVDSLAIAEGMNEAEYRYDLFGDAVKGLLDLRKIRSSVVVASPNRRQFGAEVATMLIYLGLPSHLFIDYGDERTYERLIHVDPDILVLTDFLDERLLPSGIRLCITFRCSQEITRFPQLDMFLINELGFLGQTADFRRYSLNRDVYYFEISERGNLIVTSLYNRVQPLLRLETSDVVQQVDRDMVELVRLLE